MIHQSVATLRVIMATAVEWGRRPDNPAARLRIPAATSHAVPAERVLTRQQLAILVAAAGTLRTETLIRTAGEAGLRRGELAGLRWPDVDLEGRLLHVRRQVVQERLVDGGHNKVETPTKGKRARRAAISEALATRLADWFAASVIERGAPADGYVWPGRGGDSPMHDRSAHRAVERASRRAGLVDGQGRPSVTLHGLRHTAASMMLGAGVPLLVVSRQLGHASPQITATIYAHLSSDELLDAAACAFEADADSGGDSVGPERRRREPFDQRLRALSACRLVSGRSGVRVPSSALKKHLLEGWFSRLGLRGGVREDRVEPVWGLWGRSRTLGETLGAAAGLRTPARPPARPPVEGVAGRGHWRTAIVGKDRPRGCRLWSPRADSHGLRPPGLAILP